MKSDKKSKYKYGAKYGCWLDYSSIVIAVLWGGMVLLLWPRGVAGESRRGFRYQSMVVDSPANLSDCKVYQRPDIISLPSSISFKPECEADFPENGFSDDYEEQINTLKRDAEKPADKSGAAKVALVAEVVRDISGIDELKCCRPAKTALVTGRGQSNIVVKVSGGIGYGAALQWRDSDRKDLFSGSRCWEVEVSLSIDSDGIPQDLFLEKPCGQSSIDRAVVRILARQDIWQKASAGTGRVLISFSPVILIGAENEN